MIATVDEMLQTYPAEINADREVLGAGVKALVECAQACTACADACLSEPSVAELVKCVRTNLDCADLCEATGRILSRHTGYDANLTRAAVEACIQACRSCAVECEKHQMHQHCRVCAESCRRCESECGRVLEAIA